MYFPDSSAFEGTIIYTPEDQNFGLVRITTPNGTATPHIEVCYIWHTLGRATPDVTTNELVNFEAGPAHMRLKNGDRVLFVTFETRGSLQLRGIEGWILADAFHQARAKLPEFRVIGTNGEHVLRFLNAHALRRQLAREAIVPKPDWRWQTRPGRGARDYEGCEGTEIERGWEDCPSLLEPVPV